MIIRIKFTYDIKWLYHKLLTYQMFLHFVAVELGIELKSKDYDMIAIKKLSYLDNFPFSKEIRHLHTYKFYGVNLFRYMYILIFIFFLTKSTV